MISGLSARVCAVFAASAFASVAAESGIDFFETRIRPIFVERCYECHSAKSGKTKGGLLLDSREGWSKGGDSGPAIIPGDPEKSLVVKAIRYTDENLQMPPKNKKLSAEQVADFEHWVKLGAPDPRSATNTAAAASSFTEGRKHWAFQPVRKPQVPSVKDANLVQTPVDNFVLSKLAAKQLKPSPKADKATLIRRAYYDLTGLPPTVAEVEAFAGDTSPDAFAKVVDKLLASPRYGERWGRYWLDVARYADTKGYVFEEERRYPYSYTFRDYVIRAFNEDLPFDQFIIQQLAADALTLGEDKRPLAGLGFLTLGRRFLNVEADIIDDRLDLVGRGLMGLTVACARCHDHKFDPISTKDYYSLYGVFASSEEPADKPLLGTNSLPKEYSAYAAERKKRQLELEQFFTSKKAEALEKVRARVGDYLLAAHDSSKAKDGGKQEGLVRERKLSPRIAERWKDKLRAATTNDPIFGPWLSFAASGSNSFPIIIPGKVNALIAAAFSNTPVTLKEASERYNALFAGIDRQWRELSKSNAPTALPDTNAEALRQVLYAADSPFQLSDGETRRLFDTPAQQKERALKRKVEELDATHPGAPPKAMALVDKAAPVEPVVFIRGNAGNRGPQVPRQFLEVLSPTNRQPFKKGSGRLELAQAIASKDNPLTARVFVNRVWMNHFGSALVRTPSDFGLRSDPPVNAELLDYLAAQFMEDGWSVKKLHRLIMLSSAYQQSSDETSANVAIDSANDYLWRMNRRRLDFEAMRDSLLNAAGRLDLTMEGHAVDITTEPFATRRTVYAFIERQNLPGVFRTFDLASPDTSSAMRFATTVPQQALFLMNSPFVIEQARHLLGRPEVKSKPTDAEKIDALYHLVYQRKPRVEERMAAVEFLKSASAISDHLASEGTEWRYGFGEVASNRVSRFAELPRFTGSAWQGGDKLPDSKLGWVTLNAEGGHVGNDLRHAAIRRWIAPRDGVIAIKGELRHDSAQGDGVRGRVISSRSGILGEWSAMNTNATVKIERLDVKKGDQIDFAVDMRTEYSFDSFIWSPRISYSAGSAAAERLVWNAREDFSGPKSRTEPLSRWQEYAQVLLLGNEFMFVD